MPYKDKDKQKACWRRYAVSERGKARKRKWQSENRESTRDQQRARYKADPEKYRTYFRNRYVLRTYGISHKQYEKMFQDQGGLCAICGREPDIHRNGISRLAIDHHHKSGIVRGLLCNNCNVGIGYLADDPDILAKASEYARYWKEREAQDGVGRSE